MYLKIAEFLFAFLLPFQDLPRLALAGFELRLSMLFVPLLFVSFIVRFLKDKSILLKAHKPLLLSLMALTCYLSLHVALINFNTRALGFLIWFFINAFVLIYAICVRSEWLAKGFFGAIILGAIHMIAQRFDPFLGVPAEKILALVDYQSHLRVFSWFGEPSFAALNLLFLLALLFFHKRKSLLPITGLLLLAMGYSYSRLGYICAVILFLIKFLYELKNKKITEITGYQLLFMLLAYAAANTWYINFYNEKNYVNVIQSNPSLNVISNEIRTKTTSGDAERVSLRKLAILRGLDVIRSNLFFGVGLGNSKAYIIENKIRYDFRVSFEGIHNLYQEIWAEIGLIGLLLYLCFLFYLLPLTTTQGILSPYLFTLVLPMQFCQNINMPILWLGAIAMLYYYKKPEAC